jgi:hypothetical protein
LRWFAFAATVFAVLFTTAAKGFFCHNISYLLDHVIASPFN